MPFVLIGVGILMGIVSFRNTQCQLGAQIAADFTGANNFFYWVAAIFIIGALGYVDELKAPSRALLGLVLVVMILSNKGFFNQFVSQLKSGSANPPPPPCQSPTGSQIAGGAMGGAVGGGVGAVAGSLNSTASTVGTIAQIAGTLAAL